jgi:hypothetical protein
LSELAPIVKPGDGSGSGDMAGHHVLVIAWRRQAGSLEMFADAALVFLSLVQVVQTNASRLHCQSGPRLALETGSGYASPITTKTATPASNTIAATKIRFFGVHQLRVIAVTPLKTAA